MPSIPAGGTHTHHEVSRSIVPAAAATARSTSVSRVRRRAWMIRDLLGAGGDG